MMSEYPRICQMKKPLTYVEMKRLLARYPQDTVISILKGMENLPSLHKRFLSANLTVHSWVSARKRRMQGLEEQ